MRMYSWTDGFERDGNSGSGGSMLRELEPLFLHQTALDGPKSISQQTRRETGRGPHEFASLHE